MVNKIHFDRFGIFLFFVILMKIDLYVMIKTVFHNFNEDRYVMIKT